MIAVIPMVTPPDDGAPDEVPEVSVDEAHDPDGDVGSEIEPTIEDDDPFPEPSAPPSDGAGHDESDGAGHDEGHAGDPDGDPEADHAPANDLDDPNLDDPDPDDPDPDDPDRSTDDPGIEAPPDPEPAEVVDDPSDPADAAAPAERLDANDEIVDEVPAPAVPPSADDRIEPVTDPAPGLRAAAYDGVYAQGVPVWVAMAATREVESRGRYDAEARGSTASGAYQVINSTWNGFGGYARSLHAPPAVQDQFAYESMVAILKRHGNDVSAIPVAWYYPSALRDPALMDIIPVPSAGNVLTPRQYQARWMAAFHRHLEAGSPVFLPADTDPLIPAIAFPVLGPTRFWDDWHADRDGGARRHEGLDLMGENGQPLRAAFDGVVTRIRPDDVGLPGVGLTITRHDGLRANYFHLDAVLRWHPDLDIGDTVKAGQIIAFMGSTGNAGIPHLHFELRTPDGEPIAPYPAVLEAIQREQCSVGIGPWSTTFESPAEITARLADEVLLAAADGATDVVLPEPTLYEIEGPDQAKWTVTSDGAVTATGGGAMIAPRQGGCQNVPDGVFGTGAAGLSIDLLPGDWWGEGVDPEDLALMLAAIAAERSLEFDPVFGIVRRPHNVV